MSSRSATRLRRRGSPYPPPPPVSIRTRSPALSCTASLSACRVVPSARSISHIAGRRIAAAMHAPGRAQRALEARRHAGCRQHEIAPLTPSPPRNSPAPPEVRTQLEALDHERIARLVHLDRDHPRVAVAHGAERPRPVLAGERAPAAEAAVVALPERAAVGPPAREGERRERAVVAARHAIGQRRPQRADDEVDQRRQRRIVRRPSARSGARSRSCPSGSTSLSGRNVPSLASPSGRIR